MSDRRTDAERFWDLVNGPWIDPRVGAEDCWLFMGGTAGSRPPKSWKKSPKPWKRYGRFRFHGRMENAHRVALILTAGEPPAADMVAGHTKCDRSLCCNLLHLEWQTQQANVREAIAKRHLGRSELGRYVSLAAAVIA
jgi:hypothetical protein